MCLDSKNEKFATKLAKSIEFSLFSPSIKRVEVFYRTMKSTLIDQIID